MKKINIIILAATSVLSTCSFYVSAATVDVSKLMKDTSYTQNTSMTSDLMLIKHGAIGKCQ